MRSLFAPARRFTDPVVRRIVESTLISWTIWRPGLFGTPPSRWANLYRIVLPIFDVIVISIGVRSIRFGVPAFDDVTGSEQFGDRWGTVLVVAGVACLAGILFPKLFVLELWGKIVVFSALVIYAVVVQALSFDPNGGTRSVVASMAMFGVLIAAFRLGDIGTERRIRNAEHAKRKAQTA